MFYRVWFGLTITAYVLIAQGELGIDLASKLADPRSRDALVASSAVSAGDYTALFLAWSKDPPKGVDERELDIGLSKAFGRLRTKEAIHFLINNIGLELWQRDNIWMKAPEVIEGQFPAVAALIAIGPDASKALVASPLDKMSPGESRLAIFAISRIADPGARSFLMSLHPTGIEAYFVQEGLKAIGEHP